MNIPFHRPILPKSFDKNLSSSIKNGWLTTGPEVRKFEEILAKYTNSNFAIAVNSCTAALHLVLAAKGFGSGDKFIAPTYTFVASVEVGEYLGMEPILIDCDAEYNLDLNKVEDALRSDEKIKAIIPVHFAGKPVDMKTIFSLSDRYNLFVLEDAAHALESESNVAKVGNTNHAAAFSFYANKNITTAGEGGAVTTNDKLLANKIRKLSLHGMSRDGWNRFKKGSKWEYDVSELGYKYNLTDVAASIGIWQMNNINKWYKKRISIFNTYQESFNKIDGIICPPSNRKDEKHAYHLYIVRLVPSKWNINRDEIIKLLNKGGIGTSVHYKPVHLHSYYQNKYEYNELNFPNSGQFYSNVFTLPLYPALKTDQIIYIIDFINSLWEKHKL